MSEPVLEVFRSIKNDEYYFRLKAANHEIVLQSEGYTAKQSAMNGAASVKTHASFDDNYRQKESSNGQFYFTLVADNGKVIGVSEMYTKAQSRDIGIEVVKVAAAHAPIVDLTDEAG